MSAASSSSSSQPHKDGSAVVPASTAQDGKRSDPPPKTHSRNTRRNAGRQGEAPAPAESKRELAQVDKAYSLLSKDLPPSARLPAPFNLRSSYRRPDPLAALVSQHREEWDKVTNPSALNQAAFCLGMDYIEQFTPPGVSGGAKANHELVSAFMESKFPEVFGKKAEDASGAGVDEDDDMSVDGDGAQQDPDDTPAEGGSGGDQDGPSDEDPIGEQEAQESFEGDRLDQASRRAAAKQALRLAMGSFAPPSAAADLTGKSAAGKTPSLSAPSSGKNKKGEKAGKGSSLSKKGTLSRSEFLNSKDHFFDMLFDFMTEKKKRERGTDREMMERRKNNIEGRNAVVAKGSSKGKKPARERAPPPSDADSDSGSGSDEDSSEETLPAPGSNKEAKIPSVNAVIFNKPGLGPRAGAAGALSISSSGVSKRSLAYSLLNSLRVRAAWAPVGGLGAGSLVGSFRRQAEEDVRKMKQIRNSAEIENLAAIGDAWLGIMEMMVKKFGLDQVSPEIWAFSQQLGELVSSRIIAVSDAEEKGTLGRCCRALQNGYIGILHPPLC